MNKNKKNIKVCKSCGSKISYKNRYIVTAGEMGTQEILDMKTGKTFWGSSEQVINDLLKHINEEDDK